MFIVINKKILITAVLCIFIASVCVSFTFYSMPVQTGTVQIKLPIIMYHGLMEKEDRQNEYMIDPEFFEQDLEYLSDNGYNTIFLSELTDYFEKGTPLPENPVIITFDDGYLNNYAYAYPILKKYKAKAVISPIGLSADDAENEEYRSPLWSQCTWQQLKEMSDSGLVEIQNHTYNLHKLTGNSRGAAAKSGESYEEYKKRLSIDLMTANDRIEKETGTRPCTFVYPFGAKSEYTEEIVRSLGFKAILDCENKMNHISDKEDLFHLHRFLRPNNLSAEEFFGEIMNK